MKGRWPGIAAFIGLWTAWAIFLSALIAYTEHVPFVYAIYCNAILLGITIGLIFYHLIFFVWTRELLFITYVLYMTASTFNIYLRENYVNSLFPMLENYHFSTP